MSPQVKIYLNKSITAQVMQLGQEDEGIGNK